MSVLKGLGVGVVTVVAGTMAYMYVNDSEVQQKTNKALQEIKELITLLKYKVINKSQITQSYEDLNTQNQQWVYNQWDSVGV